MLQRIHRLIWRGRPAPRHWPLIVVGLTIISVGIVFRIWKLGNIPGVNGDEAWYGVQAINICRGELDTWQTPTGNILNPFYLGPLAALHCVFQPSFALLRSVAVASGVLALVVNFFFCRRVFDRTTAWLSTMLLAALPINIAYSRFGWDQSQGLLATLPVIYYSLAAARGRLRWKRWLFAGVLAQGVALLVHPTNVFVAPFLVIAVIIAWRPKSRADENGRAPSRWLMGPLLVMALAGSAIVGVVLRGREETVQYLVNVERLFSGVTVYRYITGSFREIDIVPRTFDSFDMVGCFVFVGMIFLLARYAWKHGRKAEMCLLLGSVATVVGMFVVVGAEKIGPNFERYAICMVAPLSLLISRAVVVRSRRSSQPRVWLLAFTAACCILLITFASNYFVQFMKTGGLSHAAFRTGWMEPKEATLRWLVDPNLKQFSITPVNYGPWPLTAERETWVVCDGWWTYWPIAYLASRYDNIHVVQSKEFQPPNDFPNLVARGNAAFIILNGSGDESAAYQQMYQVSGGAFSKVTHRAAPPDYSGAGVISINRVKMSLWPKDPPPKD